ncbi:MAG TPA: hypothetical protein VMX54_05235 [Vicinamibacteria bacterium]|nr:hypothetical protein [Vicinamibacteria bacterium]
MSGFPGSPRLVRGGLVIIDPDTAAVQRFIALQYNPDTLTRTLQVQGAGEGAAHAEVLRLKGPPVETIRLEAELDATDQLEAPDDNPDAVQYGLEPQLAALEVLVYPSLAQVQSNRILADGGMLEILPVEAPLTVFVWSRNRVMPVRITDFSITEEAFDPALNPIRARVSLGLRVLSVNDLGFDSKASGIFMVYHQQKETLAALDHPAGGLGVLGITEIP